MGLPYANRLALFRGQARTREYLLSATPDGVAVQLPPDAIDRGGWADKLDMFRPASKAIIEAAGTAIRQLAQRGDLIEGTPAPDDRTADDRIPPPVPGALPEGYGAAPGHIPPSRQRRQLLTMASIAARRPHVALTIGASVASPFIGTQVAGMSFWWELTGPARRGKTAAMSAAGSVWGDPRERRPDSLLGTWNSTGQGFSRLLGRLGIYPAFLDESGTVGWSAKEWGQHIYATANGNIRQRAARVGVGQDNTPGWTGVLFLTGNAPVLSDPDAGAGALGGAVARIITLAPPFTRGGGEADRLKLAAAEAYGLLGPMVRDRYTVAEFRRLLARVQGALRLEELDDVPLTLGRHLAWAVAGAAAADVVLGTGARLYGAALVAALEYLEANRGGTVTDGQRALDHLAGSMSASPMAWQGEDAYRGIRAGGTPGAARELAGLLDPPWVWVYPATWDAMVKATGIDSGAALRELYDLGALDVPRTERDRGRWTVKGPRWVEGGARPRMYRLAQVALDGPDDGGPEGGPSGPQGDSWDPTAACPPSHPLPDPMPVPEALEGLGAVVVQEAPGPVDQAPAHLAAVPPPGALRRAEFLEAAAGRQHWAKVPELAAARREELARILEELDGGDPQPGRLRLLGALEGRDKAGGPFAPLLGREGRGRAPFWRASLPPIVEDAQVRSGWSWERPWDGPVTVLDRNAGWPTAASSVVVAHGALTRSAGSVDLAGPGAVAPGYYRMTVYRWAEAGLPSPLPGEAGEEHWVTAPQAALLRDLAAAGRWPDAMASAAWTGKPVRLTAWAGLLGEARRYALEAHGPDSAAYSAVKRSGGQALSMLRGRWDTEGAQARRVWDQCRSSRLDWAQHIEAQQAVTIWRDADKALGQAGPELGPVALRNMDELVIPAAALEAVQAARADGKRAAVVLDPTGATFGTYKIKSEGARP